MRDGVETMWKIPVYSIPVPYGITLQKSKQPYENALCASPMKQVHGFLNLMIN